MSPKAPVRIFCPCNQPSSRILVTITLSPFFNSTSVYSFLWLLKREGRRNLEVKPSIDCGKKDAVWNSNKRLFLFDLFPFFLLTKDWPTPAAEVFAIIIFLCDNLLKFQDKCQDNNNILSSTRSPATRIRRKRKMRQRQNQKQKNQQRQKNRQEIRQKP